MRDFPENYQRLQAFNHNHPQVWHGIHAYLESIKKQISELEVGAEDAAMIEYFLTRIDRLANFLKRERLSISAENLDYVRELLIRVNCYIETQGKHEENNKQLKMLLNHKVAGVFDRDIADAIFYSVGTVLMASIALMAVVGAVAFAMAHAPMTMIVLLSAFLLGMGCAFLDSKHQEEAVEAILVGALGLIIGLCLAPGLFFLTVGAYLAATVVFFGGAYGASACVTNTSLAAYTYAFKSDANTLMTSGFFAETKAVDDEPGLVAAEEHVM